MRLYKIVVLLIVVYQIFMNRSLYASDSIPIKFSIGLDQRKAMISNNSLLGNSILSSINGVTVAVNYKTRLKFGLGVYLSTTESDNAFMITNPSYVATIHKNSPMAVKTNSGNGEGYLVNSSLSMRYLTAMVEYEFFQSKWLDLSIPFEVGVGTSSLALTEFFSKTKLPITTRKNKLVPSETTFTPALLGLKAYFNLSPDVMFVGSFGYRLILKEVGVSQNFDGIYYQLGLQLIPQRIINAMKVDFKRRKEK
jgi:hypothetical protein